MNIQNAVLVTVADSGETHIFTDKDLAFASFDLTYHKIGSVKMTASGDVRLYPRAAHLDSKWVGRIMRLDAIIKDRPDHF